MTRSVRKGPGAMAYSPQVLEHFSNPRNVGSLDRDDPTVGTGIVGAPRAATS